ncbi:putative peptidoglycan glycosyltransferase FtsW [Desulfovibrionales bacterium]
MNYADTDQIETLTFYFDFWLLAGVILVTVLGLVMVLSSTGVMAEKFFGGKNYFFVRQIVYTCLGFTVMTVTALVPIQQIYRMKYLILSGVVLLLLLIKFTPMGAEINGAKRWLRLGPISLQPMEFAKLATVFYLAWFFSAKQDLIKTFSVGVVPPFAITTALGSLLLLQPDFGGAAILALLLFLMCLAGGTRFIYLLTSIFMAAGTAWLLVRHSPYRFKRLLAFLDPFKDAMDTGYQLVQSLYALGSGGITGAGLGAGKQKLFFLPEAHNDFIVAVIGEELGFVGVSLVFLLVGFILWRAFAIALAQEKLHDRLTAYGMALILTIGSVMNMAVALGTVPPKGVSMPFLSYGGSNLITSFACVGILLNLSRNVKTPTRFSLRNLKARLSRNR